MAEEQREILIGAAELAARVDELGRRIADEYGRELTMVVVLKGAFVFAADLARALSRAGASVRIEFLRLASYHDGRESSGQVDCLGPCPVVTGARVLVVEDILDTGRTALAALELLRRQRPAEIRLCALLDKPSRRHLAIEGDWIGFAIPDRFVVGYGIDHAERHRELPEVAALS